MEYKRLTNPPIQEAIFDIRVELPEETSIDHLEPAFGQISDAYPTKKPIRNWEGRFEFKEDSATSHHRDLGILGFVGKSSDEKQIVQCRLDGFTFNRLRPYPGWDKFSDEAFRLWQAYMDNAKPLRVTRIALRFINKLEFNYPLNWSELLTTPPQVPAGFPRECPSFLTRYALKDPTRGLQAFFLCASEPSSQGDKAILTLDLDVFKALGDGKKPSHDIIKPIMASLRELRSTLFFESLHEKAVESYL